jgi:hypothetical protein
VEAFSNASEAAVIESIGEEESGFTQSLGGGMQKGLDQALESLIEARNGGRKLGCDTIMEVDAKKHDKVIELTDMRGCYPYLAHDAEAFPNKKLEALRKELGDMVQNKDGSSDSKIFMAEEFVVKTIPEEEVFGIRSALLKLHAQSASTIKRQKQFGSFITPVAAIVVLRNIRSPTRLHRTEKELDPDIWVIMRRASLTKGDMEKFPKATVPDQRPQERRKKGEAREFRDAYFDLKGPGHHDTKSDWKGTWPVKDRGFKTQFPLGLEISGTGELCEECTCKHLKAMLEMDSEVLSSMQVTDYSLFIQLHQVTDERSLDTLTDWRTTKGFPLVFPARKLTGDAKDPRPDSQMYIVTFGLIDFGNTKVANAIKRAVGSTVFHPTRYARMFQDMFGNNPEDAYFTCPGAQRLHQESEEILTRMRLQGSHSDRAVTDRSMTRTVSLPDVSNPQLEATNDLPLETTVDSRSLTKTNSLDRVRTRSRRSDAISQVPIPELKQKPVGIEKPVGTETFVEAETETEEEV